MPTSGRTLERIMISPGSETIYASLGAAATLGLAAGGSKPNVIPAQAWAEVDVRIARKADGARIERRFARLKAAGADAVTPVLTRQVEIGDLGRQLAAELRQVDAPQQVAGRHARIGQPTAVAVRDDLLRALLAVLVVDLAD